MRSVVTPLAVATILLTAAVAPVHAQVDSREGIALQNEIYQLRQELRTAEDQMARGGSVGRPAYAPQQQPGGGDLVAQLLTRVDALEEQVRQLRGRIDETQNQLQQQTQDINKRIDDLAFQINPNGGLVGANPNGGQPGAPAGAQPFAGGQGPAPTNLSPPPPFVPPPNNRPAAPRGPRTPETTLQEGNAALARRDYPAAETAAREVLSNRTSPRAYDAQLLLAQALAGERQYAQAAIAYDDAFNRSRKGSHAQDALLGLATSLTAINEKKAACDTLTRLRADFPQPRLDIRQGMAAAAQKAGCH